MIKPQILNSMSKRQEPTTFAGIYSIKQIRNIPCSCCGRTMTTTFEIKNAANLFSEMRKKELSAFMQRYKTHFKGPQKRILSLIQKFSKEWKSLNIREILEKILCAQQGVAPSIILTPEELKYLQKILRHLEYKKLSLSLFSPSLITIDHIKPQKNQGASDFHNYILMCQDCNGSKKATPFAVFMYHFPDLILNIKKHIKALRIVQKTSPTIQVKNYITKYLPALKERLRTELQDFLPNNLLEKYLDFLFLPNSGIEKKEIKNQILTEFEKQKIKLEQLELEWTPQKYIPPKKCKTKHTQS